MFGIGTGELIIIIIVAILVFGPKRLPEVARTVGKVMADLRGTTNEFKRNLEKEIGVDKLEDLHPRRIADKIVKEVDIIDSLPKSYSENFDDSIYKEQKQKPPKKNVKITNSVKKTEKKKEQKK